MSESLSTDIQYIKGVGPRLGKLLKQLDILTVHDFLFTFPRSYDDRRQLKTISKLSTEEPAGFVATIKSFTDDMKGKLSIIKCLLSDSTGSIVGVWFNQKYLKKVFRPGLKLFIKGKLDYNAYHSNYQIQVSDFEVLESVEIYQQSVGRVLPVYPLVNGLLQYKMRQMSSHMMTHYLAKIPDPLPVYIKAELNLIELKVAVKALHYPDNLEVYNHARYRIVFDDFFYFQLSLGLHRQQVKQRQATEPLAPEGLLVDNYLSLLPYTLTVAQQKAIDDIAYDVKRSVCMNRIIQGDVGCGKTDVAIVALIFALQSGKKGAIMAPTELLAEQHYLKMCALLGPLGITVVFLKGKMKVREKKAALKLLEDSKLCVVIGTHALIQQGVDITNLGLVVVDEQHRFGVSQRQDLWAKGQHPHCLFMTATPIPRSLMLTCFGDLDKSIIDELPPGRIPAVTRYARTYNMQKVYTFCLQKLKQGQQVYFVYPLVEESEKLDLQAALQSWEYMKSTVFKEYSVGLLHGRMTPKEKTEIMNGFRENKIQVLVATTVIEVGIDVPNATVMIINHAERFGLSQLHQLRGRVGRGQKEAICFLVGDPRNDIAKQRIKAMLDTSDGFKIAEKDLMIRGPGDMLGTRQSGLPNFKMANLIKDEKVLVAARMLATRLIQEDPDLNDPRHQQLKRFMSTTYKAIKEKQLN